MKKILLFLFLIGLTGFSKAQSYPLGKDGSTWQYFYTSLSSYSCYSGVVDGDTTVNGHVYKKLYLYYDCRYDRSNATFHCAFREEGDKIYGLPNGINQHLPKKGGEVVLYDFSLKEGDVYPVSDGRKFNTVEKIDYVNIDGRQCKRIYFSGWDEWIEGIGSLSRPFGCPLSLLPNNGSSTTLEMFEQDGKVLYGSKRFNLLANGVHWTERTSTHGNVDEAGQEIFELQRFSVSGDSVINGITYKIIYVNDYPYMNLREDENRNIYYYNSKLNKDGLLYNFGSKNIRQDGMHYADDTGKDCIILKGEEYVSNTMSLLGHYYLYFPMKESSYHHQKNARSENVFLIHGVGLTQGIFQHIFTEDIKCVCYNDLVSIYNSDNELVYQNPDFNEDGEFTSGISSALSYKKLVVTMQKGEVTFTLPELSQKVAPVLYIYGIDGSLFSARTLESGVATVSLVAGTYLYRLTAESGNLEAGKFVVGK